MSDAMQWLDSSGEFHWGYFLWDAASKGTLLLAAAWAIDRLWLRRRLLVADVLWTATLLGLLALPLGAAALPRITLPVWRAPAAVVASHQDAMVLPAAPIVLDDVPLIVPLIDGGRGVTATAPSIETNQATTRKFSWPSWGATAAAV